MSSRRWTWLVGCWLSLTSVVTTAAGASATRLEDVEFTSHGVTLSGSIAWPEGMPLSAVVFIHGSGKQGRNVELASRFAAAGIAALVYDKRGAGKSGGQYEEEFGVSGQNIELLADDAAAALDTLASRPALRGVPLGYTGISQAGWIAPLAAKRSAAAKFLVLWSGPVCRVSEEDIYSKFTHDADGGDVPGYAEALAARTDRYVWPASHGVDTDPASSLANLSIPGLWIFGKRDGSIPVDLSITRLQALQASGRRYEYLVVPALGHENMSGTFELAIDWIKSHAK